MPMIAINQQTLQSDISSEENDDEHEEHTLSIELKPPREESVWIAPSFGDHNSEEDDSVVHKIHTYRSTKYL